MKKFGENVRLPEFESLRNWSLFAVTILYGLGLFVSHLHLSAHYVFAVSLLKVDYVLCGTCCLFYLFVPCIALFVPVQCAVMNYRDVRLLAFSIACIPIAILLFAFPLAILMKSGGEQQELRALFENTYKVYTSNWIIPAVILAFVYLPSSTLWLAGTQRITTNRFIIFSCAIILSIGIPLYIVLYAVLLHPRIDVAFGGGRTRSADILLTENGAYAAYNLELTTQAQQRIISHATVVYENEKSFYLDLPSSSNEGLRSIRLPKDLTIGIRFWKYEPVQLEKRPIVIPKFGTMPDH